MVSVIILIWGILSFLGMFIASVPFLGWLNWGVIPFSLVGVALGIVDISKSKRASRLTIAGVILCSIAILAGVIRLQIGCGII